jgi:hypothetical protein
VLQITNFASRRNLSPHHIDYQHHDDAPRRPNLLPISTIQSHSRIQILDPHPAIHIHRQCPATHHRPANNDSLVAISRIHDVSLPCSLCRNIGDGYRPRTGWNRLSPGRYSPPFSMLRVLYSCAMSVGCVQLRFCVGQGVMVVYFDKERKLTVIQQRSPFISREGKAPFVRDLWRFVSCYGFARVIMLASSDAARRMDEQIRGYHHCFSRNPPSSRLSWRLAPSLSLFP